MARMEQTRYACINLMRKHLAKGYSEDQEGDGKTVLRWILGGYVVRGMELA
jgi:hypothetical protein